MNVNFGSQCDSELARPQPVQYFLSVVMIHRFD